MADNKISDLPTTTLTTDDLIEVEQPAETAGTRSRKATLAQAIALALDNDPTLAGDSAVKAPTQQAVKAALTGGGVEVITEASAFTATEATHAGNGRYVRAGDDVTFDSAEAYSTGAVFHLRATTTIELIEDGVTLTPPAGGTLEMEDAMSVTVVMTSGTTADVIGQTVPA